MLCHRVSTAAIGAQVAGEAARADRVAVLRKALAAWDHEYQALLRWDTEADDVDSMASLDRSYAEVRRAAAGILEADGTLADPAQLTVSVDALLAEEETFLHALDAVVNRYARRTEARIGELKRIERMLFGIRLLVLFLAGAFVLRPGVRRIGDAMQRLERTHDALTRSEARKAAILEVALDAIITMDQEERVVEFNPAAERIFGYTRTEALGRRMGDLVLPADARERYRGLFAALLTTGTADWLGRRFEIEAQRADGERIPVELAIARLDQEGGALFTCFLRDIAARKQAEAALATEADIAAALARVGRELIAGLDAPDLLQRLCRLTTEVLDCEFSHTWLWNADEEVSMPVAGFGDPPDQWEAMRMLRLPRSPVASAVDGDVWQLLPAVEEDPLSGPIAAHYGITRALYIPLRRSGVIVGGQSAGDRGRSGPFSEAQFRIAAGLGQVASLALEHARVRGELEHANRVKSNFVATMSHELRRSLGTIIGYIDLLLNGEFGSLTPEGAETLRKVARSGWESLEVIKATLDLSRSETKPVPLDLRDVSVSSLLGELATETRVGWDRPEVRVVWEVPSDLPLVRTDPVKLKMVLSNLVGNARKFTRVGTVTVSAAAMRDGMEFVVRDTGVGIPPESIHSIFEPFQQVEGTQSQRYGGVGLGLYIVRRVVGVLGGTITVESEVGHGSTFTVRVPLRPPDQIAETNGGRGAVAA